MRHLIIIILLFLAFVPISTSQYDSKGSKETSRFRPGIMWYYRGINSSDRDSIPKYDRLIVEATYNDWVGDNAPFQVKGTSLGIGTNLLFDVPLHPQNKFSFGWGFNHHWTHIRHDNTFFINMSNHSTEYTLLPVKRNTALNFHQISLPIELRLHSPGWKHFKIHLGGKIGYLYNMNEKTKLFSSSGKKTILKDYNFHDERHVQYSAHVRLGFRYIALFGEYNFSPLFAQTHSSQLNIFRMGLSLSLF